MFYTVLRCFRFFQVVCSFCSSSCTSGCFRLFQVVVVVQVFKFARTAPGCARMFELFWVFLLLFYVVSVCFRMF